MSNGKGKENLEDLDVAQGSCGAARHFPTGVDVWPAYRATFSSSSLVLAIRAGYEHAAVNRLTVQRRVSARTEWSVYQAGTIAM